MAEIRVNPTRMELKRLQGKLATARRGHKLLKDKRDELVRRFMDIIKETRDLRESVCARLRDYNVNIEAGMALTDKKTMIESLMLPKTEGHLQVGSESIMGVTIPQFEFNVTGEGGMNYGYAFTPYELDSALDKLGEVLPDLVRLAQLEKTVNILGDEIEKTRRRVNALEHIMIPNYERAIKQIAMKLEEADRGNITRLMKVKQMIVEAHLRAKS
ncbi:MAG: V-type ATP synthase subunit D [Clostridia bacterium]|nr:V-type ATP synthase subunit D [Clostridia bacterium]